MNRILFLFLFLLVLGNATKVNAQVHLFNRDDSIPVIINGDTLSNAWAGGINSPLFSEIDLNGDGIHDLFLFDRSNNRISTFINDGTAGVHAWHYAPEYISHFPPISYWVRLYDYNCDGKMDLFTLSPCECGVSVYRNDFDSTAGGLRFTLVTPQVNALFPGNLSADLFASSISFPAFEDVDGDGDMDIVGYNSLPDGRLLYYRNYSEENGHGCDSLEFKLETSTWGNFRLSQGTNNNVLCFSCRSIHQAEGSNSTGSYVQSEAANKDISSVFLIDIDGDGDKDVLIGGSSENNTLLVVNGGTIDTAQMVSQDIAFPSTNVPVNITDFTVHSYIDVDNDSIKDLLVAPTLGENLHGIDFYKNQSTTNNPDFHFQTNSFLVDQMIDAGEGACPVLFDADGDGLQDLVIGNYGVFNNVSGGYKTGMQLYKNTGTVVSPSFQLVDYDYAGIVSFGLTGPVYPAFGDMDGDGAKDMILGSSDGRLIFFHNTGSVGNPASFPVPVANYMNIDVGNTSTPQIIDLNRDGLPDLIIGCKNGIIKYYQNTGTITNPLFASTPTKDTLGGIVVQHSGFLYGYSVPFVYDDNGHFQLLVSCSIGNVYLYDNIDGNLNGNFNLVDTIIKNGMQGSRFGFNLAVSGGDLNNDGRTEMLLGLYSGGVSVYTHSGAVSIVELPLVVKPSFLLTPNPSDDQCAIQFFNLPAENKNQLNVMNYLGQKIFSKPIHEDRVSFSIKDLAAGVYMVQLLTSQNSVTEKLIVKH